VAYFQNRAAFVKDLYVGWTGLPASHSGRVRVGWHSLFARNMSFKPLRKTDGHVPEYTVIDAPSFHALPCADKVNSSAFILVNFAEKLILIWSRDDELCRRDKKSIFSVMNSAAFKDVLPMHCSRLRQEPG
jgi:phosphoenolpyruvate carboxykinase (ATP)